MGWVSMFDPEALARLLGILCLAHVEAFYPAPMLEMQGWSRARPLHELVFHNAWGYTPV